MLINKMIIRSHIHHKIVSLTCKRLISSSTKSLPNLDLKNKIEKTKRKGSFMRDFYFRRVDPQILAFPKIIVEQNEIDAMSSVPEIIKENVDSLKHIGDRTATEIANIYEAAGQLGVPNITEYVRHTMSQFAMDQVGRKDDFNCNIAYAYTERNDKMGALPISEWDSIATFDEETQKWNIKGYKTMLPDQPYDKYLVYCLNKQITIQGWPDDRPHPPGYGVFLLNKEDVKVSTFELGEIKFQKIDFDVSLGGESVVFLPSIDRSESMKSKAIGHLAIAAWTVGRLKNLYQHATSRRDLQWHFAGNLYSLEALVYYIAGLMDSFEQTDFELEGLALKVNAMEVAKESMWLLQQCQNSSQQFGPFGPLNDTFALADLYLESSDKAQMLLGIEGLSYYASYEHDYIHKLILAPLYPSVSLAVMTNVFNRMFKRNTARIKAYFDDANYMMCVLMENLINDKSVLTELMLSRHSKDVLAQQLHCKRLGNASALIIKMLACHIRADMALVDKLEGCDHEICASNRSIRDDYEKAKNLLRDIYIDRVDNGDAAIDKVHSRSLKFGGYWAYSPLDKVHY